MDDNEDITLFIKNLQNEYQVDEASNAVKAFDLLEEKAYDLIISDIINNKYHVNCLYHNLHQ